jgi:lycopene cyclase domain-containing protein
MLIFILVPLSIVWAKYYRVLLGNKKTILSVVCIAIVYQLIVDIFVQRWGAWFFSPNKIFGYFLFKSPIEDTIFMALFSLVVSSSVIAFIYRTEKHARKP